MIRYMDLLCRCSILERRLKAAARLGSDGALSAKISLYSLHTCTLARRIVGPSDKHRCKPSEKMTMAGLWLTQRHRRLYPFTLGTRGIDQSLCNIGESDNVDPLGLC